ncbi:MAG: hypothetical protein BYD32DRAFT_438967 [Podila humilis]|nr:MAG: hypothetical protein BYD32DRAFT_438967 [Podila humilis]
MSSVDSTRAVQTIMTSCPLLEEFSGNKVQALDMMEGKPWVCLSLRVLDLMIEMDPEMEGQPRITRDSQQLFALRQISRLTRMERIEFTGYTSCSELAKLLDEPLLKPNRPILAREEPRYNLELRLSKGLGLLCTLPNLKFIRLPSGQDWSMRDIDWARMHWPRLEFICGLNNRSLF